VSQTLDICSAATDSKYRELLSAMLEKASYGEALAARILNRLVNDEDVITAADLRPSELRALRNRLWADRIGEE